MRRAILLSWLLILLLLSYQSSANESNCKETVHLQGLNVSKSDSIEVESQELDAMKRLSLEGKGGTGKGGTSSGGGRSSGGNSEVLRQPPSERKSNAPPMTMTMSSPFLLGLNICVHLLHHFLF